MTGASPLIRSLAETAERQRPYAVAVVIPTLLRPGLTRAIRSIFAQDFAGRIQILLGIDVPEGDPAQLSALAAECPPHVAFDLFDPGYSTSIQHGGVHPNRVSGSLRTVLTYAANSRRVAYLDDDNWWGPDHLATLSAAMEGYDWSWSLRWFVDPESGEPICPDDWESVGPSAGVFEQRYGGFVDPSSLMFDKINCPDVAPLWSLTPYENGRGSDRLVFTKLKDAYRGNGTGNASSFYTITTTDPLHLVRLQKMRQHGAVLPSERDSVTRLADLVRDWPAAAKVRGAETPGDAMLANLLTILKPAEIIVLGAGDGSSALLTARTAAAAGLDCLIVATSAPAAEHAGLRRNAGLVAPVGSDPGAWRVSVDLVQLGPDAVGEAAWRLAWPLLRAGGFLLGRGVPDAVLQRFVAATSSNVMTADFPAWGACWIIEKGIIPL